MSIEISNALHNVNVSLPKAQTTLPVDVTKFNQSVLDHIFNYGLRQILNDAMAGSDKAKPDECLAAAQKRLDNMYAGTLRASPIREGDPVRRMAMQMALRAVQASPKVRAFIESQKLKMTDPAAVTAIRQKAEAIIGNYTAAAQAAVEAERGIVVDIEI